jgi:hypothetical protein
VNFKDVPPVVFKESDQVEADQDASRQRKVYWLAYALALLRLQLVGRNLEHLGIHEISFTRSTEFDKHILAACPNLQDLEVSDTTSLQTKARRFNFCKRSRIHATLSRSSCAVSTLTCAIGQRVPR